MSEITREQFAQAVTATLRTVRHLHRELAKVYDELRDALEIEPSMLRQIVSPTDLKNRVRGEMKRPGLSEVYTAMFAESLDGDEGEEEDADDSEKPSRNVLTLQPDQPVLAVKIMLLDNRSDTGSEPQILYTVLTDWRVGQHGDRPKEIKVRRYMTRRIPNIVDPGLVETTRSSVRTRASVLGGKGQGNRSLYCRVAAPVQSVAIYTLDGAQAVEKLAADILNLWQRVTSTHSTET
jgi:hypothetical protein